MLTGPALALMKASSSVPTWKWRRIRVLASGVAKVRRPQWMVLCRKPFSLGQRGEIPRNSFTAKKKAKTKGRTMLNIQRRDHERLPRSSAVLATSAMGRLWSR